MWGLNWSSLVYSSRLLFWLSTLGTVLYVGLTFVLSAFVQRNVPSEDKKWYVRFMSIRGAKARRLSNRWIPRVGLLMVGYILGRASLFSPVREYHNVEVIRKDAERVYTVAFPGVASPITIRLCPEGDDLPLQAGMVIDPFQLIQKSDCVLIDKDTFIDYRRIGNDVVDKHGKKLFHEGG